MTTNKVDRELLETLLTWRTMAYENLDKLHIVCAANKMQDGTVVMGVRHCCPVMQMNFKRFGYSIEDVAQSEQGFMDNFGRFLSREDAWKIATENKQVQKTHLAGMLFSEDLY